MSTLSTHVLDTTRGRPAAGVTVRLHRASGELIAEASTDDDGRVGALGPDDLAAGTYTLTFATAAYFATTEQPTFFPEVAITFHLSEPARHHHVPLLLSPFAYSTYRGS